MALLTTGLACLVYVPSGAPALQTLAELGGARASHMGELPQGADVIEGDELRLGARTYIVERAIPRATVTWCALSEVRGALAVMPSGSTRVTRESATRMTQSGETRVSA